MKELRFRAWNIKKRKYIDIDTLYCANGEVCGIVCSSVVHDTEDVILEQYTGLKDKNGKEIYEGDVVNYKLYADSRLDYIDEVFYSTMSGAFMVGEEDNIRTLDCLVNIEVIGNIHEDKELLGGEE